MTNQNFSAINLGEKEAIHFKRCLNVISTGFVNLTFELDVHLGPGTKKLVRQSEDDGRTSSRRLVRPILIIEN